VITAGALEALNLSLQAVTEPGDWVVVENPCFYGALQALERLRLKALSVATDVKEGIDLAALEQALQSYPVKACWLMTNGTKSARLYAECGKRRSWWICWPAITWC
jgi:DNA-binding transcriptional MocR family regulator